MKDWKKYSLIAAVAVTVGVLIGYFLFSGSIANNVTNQTYLAGGGVSATTPADNGNQVCTQICVPKPNNCPKTCPTGQHYQCSGTIAMNCGCFPDVPAPTCTQGQTFDTGRNACVNTPIGVTHQ